MDTSIIRAFLERPVAVHSILIKATGSVKLAVMLSQLIYWTDRTNDPEGWIYKTQKDMFDETGMSRTEQETARTLGAKLGVLESDVRGRPPVMHYRVNIDKLIVMIQRYNEQNGKQVEKKLKATGGMEYLKNMSEQDVQEMMAKFRVSSKCVRDRAQDVIDYCEAKGKRYSDYKAALRNFLKSHIERHPDVVQRESTAYKPVEREEKREEQMTPEQRATANKRLEEMRAELARKKAMKV